MSLVSNALHYLRYSGHATGLALGTSSCAVGTAEISSHQQAASSQSPPESVNQQGFSAGILSAPSADNPESILRNYLRNQSSKPANVANDELQVFRSQQVKEGAVVTLQQHHQGILVIGGRVTGRTDTLGRVRWVRSDLAQTALMSVTPTVDSAQILTSLTTSQQFAGTAFENAQVTLVIYAVGAHAASPRLAWQIRPPANLKKMEVLEIYADAHTGAVIAGGNTVKHAASHKARVFSSDPLASPELTEVSFDHLPAGATKIDDKSFKAYTCLDERACQAAPDSGAQEHVCTFRQTATTDSAGTFLQHEPKPGVVWNDSFAEVSAYYHMDKVLQIVRDRMGIPNLINDVKFTVVTNTPSLLTGGGAACIDNGQGRFAPPNDAGFEPYENAFFVNLPPGLPAPLGGPTMVFGQGAFGDYAYEGGVAYHEFGHGLFSFIGSKLTPDKTFPDKYGINTSPGALDEGFGDYMAFMITKNPRIGDYVGGGTGLRTAANNATCPASLTGEEHDDSVPWSGALWSIRESLTDADQLVLDGAFLTTMTAVTDSDTFGTVAEMLLAEIEQQLGKGIAVRARIEMDLRGFTTDDCEARVVTLASDVTHRQNIAWTGPGPQQLRIALPADSDTIEVSTAAISAADPSVAPTVTLHLKTGNKPIVWDWTNPAAPSSDADLTIPFEFTLDPAIGAYRGTAVAKGQFAAGTYLMQVSNGTPGGVIVAPKWKAGKADGASATESPSQDTGGCNAPGGQAGAALALVGFAALLSTGRRRK
jgi:Zn-dependent metalloprotease